ncbi:hypothetical protein FXO37_06285 [Capsicum annuum]|nr:hypothetical protein FXO37_06285 [Capsicum annuum]
MTTLPSKMQHLAHRDAVEASESINQEEGWVVCRVFKKKNYHKDLESPQNSSAALSRRGDMFQSIPHADAILLKLVMHNWSNEDCMKILQRCREASTYKDEGRKRKVLIIDMVLNRDDDEADMTEVKLLLAWGVCVCVCRELRKNGKGFSLSVAS